MNNLIIEKENEQPKIGGEPMPSFVEKDDAHTGRDPIVIDLKFDTSAVTGIADVDENEVNDRRLRSLCAEFTEELVTLIHEEHFEYGVGTQADVLVQHLMEINSLVTKSWLSSIFLQYYEDPIILVGLLRIVARLDFHEVYPEGQTIALAATVNNNSRVQECGIRAFENWGNLESLRILESTIPSTRRLEQYLAQVLNDLRVKHNVITG